MPRYAYEGPDSDEKASGNDNHNLHKVLKATMHEDIWPQSDLLTAVHCFAETIALGPNSGIVRRNLLAATRAHGRGAPDATGDVQAFMLELQNIAACILRLHLTK